MSCVILYSSVTLKYPSGYKYVHETYLPKHIRPLLRTVCPFVCPDNRVRSETIGNQSRFHESTTDGYTRREARILKYLSMNSPFAGDFGTPNPSKADRTELQLLLDEGAAWVRCKHMNTTRKSALLLL